MNENVILVLCGGLLGWLFTKLPDLWVYVIAVVTVIAAVVVYG